MAEIIVSEARQRQLQQQQEETQKKIEQLAAENKKFQVAVRKFVDKQKAVLTQEGKLSVAEGIVEKLGKKAGASLKSGTEGLVELLTGTPAIAKGAGGAAGGLSKLVGLGGKQIIKANIQHRDKLAQIEQERQEKEQQLAEERERRFEENFTKFASSLINEQRAEQEKGPLSGSALAAAIQKAMNDSEFVDIVRDRIEQNADSIEKDREIRQRTLERTEKVEQILGELRDLAKDTEKKQAVQRLKDTEERREARRERFSKESTARRTGSLAKGVAKGGGAGGGLIQGIFGGALAGLATGIGALGTALAGAGALAKPIAIGGAALGAGLGAFFALGGGGVAAGVKLISLSLQDINKPLEQLSAGIKSFEQLDGQRLSVVGQGLQNFPFTSLITAGIGNWVNELASTPLETTLGGFARGMKEFDMIDAENLTRVGDAVRNFPLFTSTAKAGILAGISGFLELLTGKSVGQVIGDFARGLGEFQNLDGGVLIATGQALKSLGSSLGVFSEIFSESLVNALKDRLAGLFGKTTLEKLKDLSKLAPQLIDSADALKALDDVGDFDFKFRFRADSRSLRDFRQFVRHAAELRENINEANVLRAEQRQASPVVIAPSSSVTNTSVNRGGDSFLTPARSGVADGTFSRAMMR